MRRSDRLFERVAPMGVNDIMMAVTYRCALCFACILLTQQGMLRASAGEKGAMPSTGCLVDPSTHHVAVPTLQARRAAAPARARDCV